MSDQPSPTSAGLLTPASRAVAGLVLAVAGLTGQNSLSTGLQILVAGPSSGDPRLFTLVLGVAAAVPAVLALLLVWPQARDRSAGWVTALSGAAAVVAAVALVGAALTVVGGLLHGGY